MNVIVQGKTLVVTPAIRSFVEQQADKLNKVSKKISQVNVFLEHNERKGNDEHRALVRYKVELPGKDVCVKSRSNDLYDAIVDANDSAVRQVRKLRERRRTKSRKQSIEGLIMDEILE